MAAEDRGPWSTLDELEQAVVSCRACPRLVAWREEVARRKRPAYADWNYWGRPVPGFGDPAARLVVVGLAPAAHGANRTGRVFTGDRSGAFLYAALHRAGFANQPTSRARDDGLRLADCWVSAALRCAPPGNRPVPAERDRCAPFLRGELALLPYRVVLALGGYAWDVCARELGLGPPRPRFAHGAEIDVLTGTLLGSYHVSQQNTFTGRLTPHMLDGVLARARELLDAGRQPGSPS
jgi:uracil-DNA glycosylase